RRLYLLCHVSRCSWVGQRDDLVLVHQVRELSSTKCI
ncbi:unnamed protein product, partial [Brassica rapa]